MADPVTIIGTLGALCNIIDVVSKTITTIDVWRTRWKDSDLNFLGLAAQLVALRAALTKIHEWMDAEAGEIHHQLTMDLDVSISYCKVLVDRLDSSFSQLQQHNKESLDMLAKLKITLGTGGVEELQKFVERQTSALTLLLIACNCKAISEQKKFLEKPKTRKTLERAKTDSASLIVHRDSTSLISKWTDNMSNISVTFDFDREVFSSRVYERLFRFAFKDTLRKPARKYTDVDSSHLAAAEHSRQPVNGGTIPTLAILEDSDPHSVKSDPASLIQEQPIAEYCITEKHTENCKHVWLMDNDRVGKAMAISYLQKGYETEIPKTKTLTDNPGCNMTFYTDGCQYLLYDANSDGTSGIGATANFRPDTTPILIFVVDLCSYDQTVTAEPYTELNMSLLRFRYLASLSIYEKSPFLLMFHRNNSMASKLQTVPLQRYFLDFDGGTDVQKATNYITRRFLNPSAIPNPERVTSCHCYKRDAMDSVKSFFKDIAISSTARTDDQ